MSEVTLWRTRFHDERGEEWMSWGYWLQKNGENGYENQGELLQVFNRMLRRLAAGQSEEQDEADV